SGTSAKPSAAQVTTRTVPIWASNTSGSRLRRTIQPVCRVKSATRCPKASAMAVSSIAGLLLPGPQAAPDRGMTGAGQPIVHGLCRYVERDGDLGERGFFRL